MLSSLYRKGVASRIFDIANIIVLVVLMFLTLYPLWYVAVLSVSSGNRLNTSYYLWPADIQLGNYAQVVKQSLFLISYKNTVIYSVVGTIVTVLISVFTAYPLMVDTFPFRKFWMFLIVFTMLFGGGLIPTYLQIRRLGLIDSIWALVLPGAASPWNIILVRTFFKTNIPQELRDAAKIDGAGEWTLLLRLMLPLSKPIMAVIGLFTFVGHWNSYFSAMIYMTKSDRYPYALILRNILARAQAAFSDVPVEQMGRVYGIGIQAAGLMLSILPLLCIYPFLQKYFTQGVLLGSLKG